ncbi:unnamed protein product [Mycena citricolor]|uniref:Uncharacterized protein n=1 Tax=Mycena citricolor TaxID=2018698 RepID=A0AAD2HK86_9AGAR|nr:unnamed protein product [Mycena citricolor]
MEHKIPGEAPKVVGSPATAVDGKLGLTSVRQTTLSFGKISSNTRGTKRDKKQKILDHDQLKASSAATKHRPDSKIVTSLDDPNRVDAPEDDDNHLGGRTIEPVLLEVSKPFWVDESSKKKGVRCAASASCGTIWASWPQNKPRVLKHASACGLLATYNGRELVTKVLHIHAQSNPELLEQLRTTMGIEPRSTTSSSQTEARNNLVEPQKPLPLKRQQTVVMTAAPAQPSSTPSAIDIDSKVLLELEEKRRYQTEGQKDLARKANDALIALVVCCGVPPHVTGTEEFRAYSNVLNARYQVPSRTHLEDTLIPVYASNVRMAVADYLSQCFFLTISCDGGKLVKRKFTSVHITTPHHQSFCMELDDAGGLSQTRENMSALMTKWISAIGPERFCVIVSDDAAYARKGQELTIKKYP